MTLPKTLRLAAICSLHVIVTIGFINNCAAQSLRSWEVALHGGHSNITGDVLSKSGIGGGVSISKIISKQFSLRADYSGSINYGLDAKLSSRAVGPSEKPADPWLFYYSRVGKPFVTNYRSQLHQLSLEGVVNVFKIKIPETGNNAVIYATGGYSLMMADIDINALNANLQPYSFTTQNIDYSAGKKDVRTKLKSVLDNTYESSADYVNRPEFNPKNFQMYHGVNVGLGVAYPITDRVGVGAAYRATLAFTDYLDGVKLGGGNDVIHFASLRLAYNFGNRVKKTATRFSTNGSMRTVTEDELLITKGGFVQPKVSGEVVRTAQDTTYYLNFSFVPVVSSTVSAAQMVFLKPGKGKVIMLPYTGVPRSVKEKEAFTFRTQLTKQQVTELSMVNISDIKIETAGYALEDQVKESKQHMIATICQQLLKK